MGRPTYLVGRASPAADVGGVRNNTEGNRAASGQHAGARGSSSLSVSDIACDAVNADVYCFY